MIKIELSFATYAAAMAALTALDKMGIGENTVIRDVPSGTVRPKAEPTKAAAPAPAPVAAPTPAPAESPKAEYKDVQAAVMALTQVGASEPDEAKQVGRQAVKAILAEMGLPSFKGSPAEVWPAAIEKLKAKLAELKGA